MSKRGPSLVGRVIWRLTVVSLSNRKPHRGVVFYNCECECGNVIEILSYNLTKKTPTKSCGCLQRDVSKFQGQKRFHHVSPCFIIDEDFD